MLTTLLLPGLGTVHDLRHTYEMGARPVPVVTHCTEVVVAKQHLESARVHGMNVSSFLMMSHTSEPEQLAGQTKLMESYGMHCVYATDPGLALIMGGFALRLQAHDHVLKSETQRAACTRIIPCRSASRRNLRGNCMIFVH